MKLRDWTFSGTNERRLSFHCPGCDSHHDVRVEPSAHAWAWNGSMDSPTFQPSILVRYHGDEDPPGSAQQVCHSFVKDGQIQFLTDCTHSLAGQTVELPEWPTPETP